MVLLQLLELLANVDVGSGVFGSKEDGIGDGGSTNGPFVLKVVSVLGLLEGAREGALLSLSTDPSLKFDELPPPRMRLILS